MYQKFTPFCKRNSFLLTVGTEKIYIQDSFPTDTTMTVYLLPISLGIHGALNKL